MQNTSVVNIEIKSAPVTKSAADVTAKPSVDDEFAAPFEKALKKELEKADAEQEALTAKKTSSNKASDTAQQTNSKQAKKAEKKVEGDGNQLPLSKKIEDSSSNADIKPTDTIEHKAAIDESEDSGMVDESEVSIAKNDDSEKIINTTVPADKTAKQPEITTNTKSAQVASQTNNNNQPEQPKNQASVISSKQLNSATPSNAETENHQEHSESEKKSSSKLAGVVISANSSRESSDVGKDASSKPLDKTETKTNSQTVEKELVIKQINIAKEASSKTDIPTQGVVASSTAQKVVKNETDNKVKITSENLALNDDLDTDNSKVNKQLTIKTDTTQLKQVVVDEPVTRSQRETMVLDKKLVEIVDANASRASSNDKPHNAFQAPLTVVSSQVAQTATTTVTAPVLDVQPTLKTEAWERVMAGRVVWMAREGLQRADLKLNPANLGPVEVRLTINNDQASVSFVAQNPTTREALEQSLPRLREGFQANGLSLTNADVSDQSMSQGQDSYEQAGSGILFSQDSDENEQLDEDLIVDSDESSRLSLYV